MRPESQFPGSSLPLSASRFVNSGLMLAHLSISRCDMRIVSPMRALDKSGCVPYLKPLRSGRCSWRFRRSSTVDNQPSAGKPPRLGAGVLCICKYTRSRLGKRIELMLVVMRSLTDMSEAWHKSSTARIEYSMEKGRRLGAWIFLFCFKKQAADLRNK